MAARGGRVRPVRGGLIHTACRERLGDRAPSAPARQPRLAFGAERDERFDWTRFEVLPDARTRAGCVDGGWEAFGFANQGQCVRFLQTGKDSR